MFRSTKSCDSYGRTDLDERTRSQKEGFVKTNLLRNQEPFNKMTINERQDEIIEEFTQLDDWMDRYQLLIDLGEEQAPLPEEEKTDANLIDGCQSRVWLSCSERDGLLHFRAESDALIVKGIVALLLQVVSGQKPRDILDADLYFIPRIGLTEHLSPTRSNGLLAMVKQVKMYALAATAKS